jgi:hypothetical protein
MYLKLAKNKNTNRPPNPSIWMETESRAGHVIFSTKIKKKNAIGG